MKTTNKLVIFGVSVLSLGLGQPLLAASPPPSVPPPTFIPARDMALPANAQPGKCYARVFEAQKYRTETEEVLKKETAERIEIIPAKYEIVEEQVLVRAAYEEEQIIPAQFETVTEKILVKLASTRWEKGRGLVEKVNNFTGEIMCLEEVPAEYQTVTKSIKESEGRMVWQEVLCETNAPELVKTQPAFTEIHAQSRSIPQQNLSDKDSGKKDWFFL